MDLLPSRTDPDALLNYLALSIAINVGMVAAVFWSLAFKCSAGTTYRKQHDSDSEIEPLPTPLRPGGSASDHSLLAGITALVAGFLFIHILMSSSGSSPGTAAATPGPAPAVPGPSGINPASSTILGNSIPAASTLLAGTPAKLPDATLPLPLGGSPAADFGPPGGTMPDGKAETETTQADTGPGKAAVAMVEANSGASMSANEAVAGSLSAARAADTTESGAVDGLVSGEGEGVTVTAGVPFVPDGSISGQVPKAPASDAGPAVAAGGPVGKFYGQRHMEIRTRADGSKETVDVGQPDQVIYETFFSSPPKSNGYFVEVGATDGLTQSNTLFFESELKWSGILIEPVPVNFQRLVTKRPGENVIKVERAVCRERGTVKFVGQGGTAAMLSKLSPVRLEALSKQWDAAHTTPYDVECEPLSEIFASKGNASADSVLTVDLMTVDVEGSELEVLQSIDFGAVKIGVLVLENDLACREGGVNECANILESHGFCLAMKLAVNSFWVGDRALAARHCGASEEGGGRAGAVRKEGVV